MTELRMRAIPHLMWCASITVVVAAFALSPVLSGASIAQEATEAESTTTPEPFSFDQLSEQMRQKAKGGYEAPAKPGGFLAELNYDDYRRIRYDPERAKWDEPQSLFHVHAFHLGWLYEEPVNIYEVVGDDVRKFNFTTADFIYEGDLDKRVPDDAGLPGVAGFRLHYPLNRADIHDELVAFAGASYFRALGQGSSYGLSARGLAINTGLSGTEEFPRFTDFYLVRPPAGSSQVVVYAALDSPSVTGAYRFVIEPGYETIMDVTARLFFRQEVQQLGVAPLTSMFLYAQSNRAQFDDYRPQVHDSSGLRIVRADGDILWRALNNPPTLASSYLTETNPHSFGLYQRERDFADYQDAGARYEARPSLEIQPVGDWGRGNVRLVEIPSDLEINDNIVAFWVPETVPQAGETREYRYRMHWGDLPAGPGDDRAYVLETRSGTGGVSGVENEDNHRKFVVDFKGGKLGRMPEDAEVEPVVIVANAEVTSQVLSKIAGTDIWRLALDVRKQNNRPIELVAHVAGYEQKLSETWLYQWIDAQ